MTGRGDRAAWRTIAAVFTIAVIVNYPWEMVQAPLYRPMGTLRQGIWRCFIASLGDGALVLVIVGIGWAAFRRAAWFGRFGVREYSLMFAVGLIIALLVESVGLRAGRWAYNSRMPIVPVVRVGLLPILQMLLLPPVIFRVTARWLRLTQ